MENFIMATLEWAICTSKDRWLKKALRPEWRLCGQAPDAIHHIISGYTKLARSEIQFRVTKLAVWCSKFSARSMNYQWRNRKNPPSANKERC